MRLSNKISNVLIQGFFLALVTSFSLVGLEAPGPRQNPEPTQTEQVFQNRHQLQQVNPLLAFERCYVQPLDYSGALLYQEQQVRQELRISMSHPLPCSIYHKKTTRTTTTEEALESDQSIA